jgi:formylglycine-generating enzyme required for sulfatase activity/tRNA A-37 threonylcarbamoyl transferase component Bud32
VSDDKPSQRPQPNRVPITGDPTQPIKLVRMKPPESKPGRDDPTPTVMTGPGADAAPAPAAPDGGWTGADKTVVTPAPAPVAATAQPAAADDGWTGSDKTVVTPTPASAEGWTGNDQTMLGVAAPAPAPAAAGDSGWTGGEATQLGITAGSMPVLRQEGSSTTGGKPKESTRSGSRTTSPTLEDGWHLKGRQGPLTGRSLGDFEIGGVLGEGGMGVVYRAKQVSLKRRAALKVLPSNLAADLRLRGRFEAEARIASLLETEHVVKVYGAGTATDPQQGEVLYFAMEFVEGTDLTAIIHEKRDKKEPFTPEEAAGYIIQAARGLAEAGKRDIVHRDIKPANLMVTTKGVVKIADFGISKMAGEHGLTMTGTTVGTPAYCSPEQGRGDTVSPRSDIYSLGIVFYELLAGAKPFDGTSANALIYQHNYQEPKLITEIRPDLPEAYQAVCMKCLMKDPEKRYADAAELVADLERVRDGNMSMTALFQAKFGTGADAAMAKYLGVKKRRWVPWTIAAGVILSVAAIGSYVYLQGEETRNEIAKQEKKKLDDNLKLRKDRLKVLDEVKPIPASASEDVAFLRANEKGNVDVPRYQKKIDRVAALKSGKELSALKAVVGLPSAAVTEAAVAPLDELVKAVSREDADVAGLLAKVDGAKARIADLRAALARDFPAQDQLKQSHVLATESARAELAELAGEQDREVIDRKNVVAAFRAMVDELGKDLTALDRAETTLSTGALDAYAKSLDVYASKVGDDDAGRRWSARIAQGRARIAALRESLGKLIADKAIEVNIERVEAMKAELQPLIGASDVLVGEAAAYAAKGRAAINALRSQLKSGLADDKHDQSDKELASLGEDLDAFTALVKRDDVDTPKFRQGLRQEQALVASAEATLAESERIDPKAWKAKDRISYAAALEAQDRRGLVAAANRNRIEGRLRDHDVEVQRLRNDINAYKDAKDKSITEDETSLANIDALQAIVGPDDADVRYWRTQLVAYFPIVDRLKVLDARAPVPSTAGADLDALARIVPATSDRLQRWRAKFQRVTALQRDLEPLGAVGPMPPDALAKAKQLVAEVGEGDAQAVARLAKAEKVTALRASLAGRLGTGPGSRAAQNFVLDPKDGGPVRTAQEVADLVANIGLIENDVQWWQYRVQVLRGPGKPAWANEGYDRDQFGLYADLRLSGLDKQVQRFRYIPAGTFSLGSPANEAGREADESLVPEVTLTKSFWMADGEVTQALWKVVMGVNPSRFANAPDADNLPVERVSWKDADAFCAKLKAAIERQDGGQVTVSLPTEAQWEYACRAGVDAPYATYDKDGNGGRLDPASLSSAAWFGLRDGPRGVRRRDPNRFGLFDMHGNVWEWCQDRYWTYSAARDVDPVGAQEETYVVRGGSWADPADKLRAANRVALDPNLRTLYVGLRVVIAATWPQDKAPARPGSEQAAPATGQAAAPSAQ